MWELWVQENGSNVKDLVMTFTHKEIAEKYKAAYEKDDAAWNNCYTYTLKENK
jgi:hypothetical protein